MLFFYHIWEREDSGKGKINCVLEKGEEEMGDRGRMEKLCGGGKREESIS